MNIKSKLPFVLPFLVVFATPLLAQTEVPHTFQAGQPARANDVNENFDVLEDATDANANRIAANEAAIESNTAALAALDSEQVTVLDFTNPDHCTIDERGYYVLDRFWNLGESGCLQGLVINAWVTLDLRGFYISGGEFWGRDRPVIVIESGRVHILDGGVTGIDVSIVARNVEETAVILENISAFGTSLGPNSRVIGGSYYCGVFNSALGVGGNSVVTGAEIGCDGDYPTMGFGGESVRIVGNHFSTTTQGIIAEGNNALILNNTFEIDSGVGIELYANGSIIEGNVFFGTRGQGTGMDVRGTSNVIDSNYAKNLEAGINFYQSGNYYGDNRVSATTPFGNAENQTDWGGNVSF